MAWYLYLTDNALQAFLDNRIFPVKRKQETEKLELATKVRNCINFSTLVNK